MSHRLVRGLLVGLVLTFGSSFARADDGAPAILDKAIKALGGEEALGKFKASSMKGKGTINVMGNDNPFSVVVTMKGLDHSRQEIEAEFGGMKIKFMSILAGNKGWRSFAGMTMELEGDALNEAKRAQYLQLMTMNPTVLKGKGFKVATAPSEKVGDKTALGLKITGPDGKTSTMYVDEASGLPVKMVAKVKDFQGEEFTQSSTFSDYKDFQGIKKATKIESTRDGDKFQLHGNNRIQNSRQRRPQDVCRTQGITRPSNPRGTPMDRRTFMQAAGALSAGLAVAGHSKISFRSRRPQRRSQRREAGLAARLPGLDLQLLQSFDRRQSRETDLSRIGRQDP